MRISHKIYIPDNFDGDFSFFSDSLIILFEHFAFLFPMVPLAFVFVLFPCNGVVAFAAGGSSNCDVSIPASMLLDTPKIKVKESMASY